LRARQENRLFDYIATSPAQVLIDWNWIKIWHDIPPIRRTFALAVDDPQANLSVLIRRQGRLDHLIRPQ
jgi:hypothetical protein